MDIKANGLWETRFIRTIFDVKIFNPHEKFCPRTIKEAYKLYEAQKRLKYGQRKVEVENSSLNPSCLPPQVEPHRLPQRNEHACIQTERKE